ncbi:MAG TPA: hypothetical protein VE547_08660, partial [Mycobacteriales bacterium]|nr:hypothetical protein [Mycobacteriales bacterium]
MRTPVRVVVGLAAVAVGLAGCTGSGPEPAPPPGPGEGPGGGVIGLVAFDSCATAQRELVRAALPYVGPYGLFDPVLTGGMPQAGAR